MAVQVSFAAPIFCEGGKWALTTSNNLKTANLKVDGEEIQFGKMNCGLIFPKPADHKPKAFLRCQTAEHVADAGFSVLINLSPNETQITGTLTETSFVGAKLLADLKCVSAEN